MEVLSLNASPRTDLGKKATKAIRKSDRIPCVLYGGSEIQHFTVAPLDLRKLVYSPEFKLVEIDVEGTKYRCILKDVHFHPVDEKILHIDFLRLIEDHPIKVDLPIHFEGVAIGLKSGGKLIKKMRKVRILATPSNLVDKIVLDTTSMELGQTQRIKDLLLTEGVTILNNENIPVASIDIPRALRTSGTTDDATAKAAAPAAKAAAPAAKAAAPAKDAKKK
jgi:large subunit ribosomal protein L25